MRRMKLCTYTHTHKYVQNIFINVLAAYIYRIIEYERYILIYAAFFPGGVFKEISPNR